MKRNESFSSTFSIGPRGVLWKIDADLYVMVNGDEPLLTEEAIVQCIPSDLDPDTMYDTDNFHDRLLSLLSSFVVFICVGFLTLYAPAFVAPQPPGNRIGARFYYLDVDSPKRGHCSITLVPIVPVEGEEYPYTRSPPSLGRWSAMNPVMVCLPSFFKRTSVRNACRCGIVRKPTQMKTTKLLNNDNNRS